MAFYESDEISALGVRIFSLIDSEPERTSNLLGLVKDNIVQYSGFLREFFKILNKECQRIRGPKTFNIFINDVTPNSVTYGFRIYKNVETREVKLETTFTLSREVVNGGTVGAKQIGDNWYCFKVLDNY